MGPEIVVLPGPAEAAEEAARRFAMAAQEAVAERGRFAVALAGGQTAVEMFRRLADPPWRERIPWQNVHLFWGDERCVPPDDPVSHFGTAHRELISRVPLPPANVHRMRGEEDPELAAAAYEQELKDFFGEPGPAFDLLFLGVGVDGHTASIFPSTPAILKMTRWVIVTRRPGEASSHLSITFPVINTARRVIFLAVGAQKAVVVCRILLDPALHRNALPAARVRPWSGQLTWILDEASARLWEEMRPAGSA